MERHYGTTKTKARVLTELLQTSYVVTRRGVPKNCCSSKTCVTHLCDTHPYRAFNHESHCLKLCRWYTCLIQLVSPPMQSQVWWLRRQYECQRTCRVIEIPIEVSCPQFRLVFGEEYRLLGHISALLMRCCKHQQAGSGEIIHLALTCPSTKHSVLTQDRHLRRKCSEVLGAVLLPRCGNWCVRSQPLCLAHQNAHLKHLQSSTPPGLIVQCAYSLLTLIRSIVCCFGVVTLYVIVNGLCQPYIHALYGQSDHQYSFIKTSYSGAI